MRKWLAAMLCVVLLLSMSACSVGDAAYYHGMQQLKYGNYAKAYAYFRDSDAPHAAAELEKFAFAPLTYARVTDDIRDEYVYTYDAQGRPATTTRTRTWAEGDQQIDMEEYGYVGIQKRTYRKTTHLNHSTAETVQTYDDQGNLTYSYYRSSFGEVSETFYAYDHWGNPLSEYDNGWNGESIYRMKSTYDDRGRLLTYSRNRNDVFTTEGYRIYNEDGSCVEHEEYTEPGEKGRRQINYDREGRVTREVHIPEGGDAVSPARLLEYRYDAAGNQVYAYSKWNDSVETTTSEYDAAGHLIYSKTLNQDGRAIDIVKQTYNEAGQIVSKETSTTGLTWNKTIYTYDENGRLVNEYISQPNAMVGRDITYTYNEDGTLKFLEETGTYGTVYNAYGYDEWGNRTQSLAQRERQETTATATWELHYYPNGVPEEVANFAKAMDWE